MGGDRVTRMGRLISRASQSPGAPHSSGPWRRRSGVSTALILASAIAVAAIAGARHSEGHRAQITVPLVSGTRLDAQESGQSPVPQRRANARAVPMRRVEQTRPAKRAHMRTSPVRAAAGAIEATAKTKASTGIAESKAAQAGRLGVAPTASRSGMGGGAPRTIGEGPTTSMSPPIKHPAAPAKKLPTG